MNELNLPVKNIIGQCYDGGANMKGKHKGVAARMLKENKKAFYVHCYAHQLNLSLESACSSISEVRNAIGTVATIHSFLKGSAKRNAVFQKLQNEHSISEDEQFVKSIKLLSATRWASRYKAFDSVEENFEIIVRSLKVFFFKIRKKYF